LKRCTNIHCNRFDIGSSYGCKRRKSVESCDSHSIGFVKVTFRGSSKEYHYLVNFVPKNGEILKVTPHGKITDVKVKGFFMEPNNDAKYFAKREEDMEKRKRSGSKKVVNKRKEKETIGCCNETCTYLGEELGMFDEGCYCNKEIKNPAKNCPQFVKGTAYCKIPGTGFEITEFIVKQIVKKGDFLKTKLKDGTWIQIKVDSYDDGYYDGDADFAYALKEKTQLEKQNKMKGLSEMFKSGTVEKTKDNLIENQIGSAVIELVKTLLKRIPADKLPIPVPVMEFITKEGFSDAFIGLILDILIQRFIDNERIQKVSECTRSVGLNRASDQITILKDIIQILDESLDKAGLLLEKEE